MITADNCGNLGIAETYVYNGVDCVPVGNGVEHPAGSTIIGGTNIDTFPVILEDSLENDFPVYDINDCVNAASFY